MMRLSSKLCLSAMLLGSMVVASAGYKAKAQAGRECKQVAIGPDIVPMCRDANGMWQVQRNGQSGSQNSGTGFPARAEVTYRGSYSMSVTRTPRMTNLSLGAALRSAMNSRTTQQSGQFEVRASVNGAMMTATVSGNGLNTVQMAGPIRNGVCSLRGNYNQYQYSWSGPCSPSGFSGKGSGTNNADLTYNGEFDAPTVSFVDPAERDRQAALAAAEQRRPVSASQSASSDDDEDDWDDDAPNEVGKVVPSPRPTPKYLPFRVAPAPKSVIASAGNAAAQEKLIEVKIAEFVHDYAAAMKDYDSACMQGSARACRLAGHLNDSGGGLGTNKAVNSKYYGLACSKQDSKGCFNLAFNMSDGPQKVTALAHACDIGSNDGCYYAGQAFESGIGVAQDINQAVPFLKRGCDLGWSRPCNHLLEIYKSQNSQFFRSKATEVASQLEQVKALESKSVRTIPAGYIGTWAPSGRSCADGSSLLIFGQESIENLRHIKPEKPDIAVVDGFPTLSYTVFDDVTERSFDFSYMYVLLNSGQLLEGEIFDSKNLGKRTYYNRCK